MDFDQLEFIKVSIWMEPKALEEPGMLGLKDSQKCLAEPCKGCQEESQWWEGKARAWEEEDTGWHPGTGRGNARKGKGQGRCPWATHFHQGKSGAMCVSQALLPHNHVPHRPAVTESARPRVEKDLLHWAQGPQGM